MASQFYQKEGNETPSEAVLILTADMQIVKLLSMNLILQHFLRRLMFVNETFCCLHESGDFWVLWLEELSGKCAYEVPWAYSKIIAKLPQLNKLNSGAGNCTAQNKNWTLICGTQQDMK